MDRAPVSPEAITQLVAVSCAVLALAAYVGLIVVPAWTSYSRIWMRLAASFLTLYILASVVLLGVGAAAAIVWFWDRIQG